MTTTKQTDMQHTINANTNESLRDLLKARTGYHTFVATMGTNGNGGMLSDIAYILEVDEEDQHLDGYAWAAIEPGELERHAHDAGGKIEDGDSWVAFDCHHTRDGYLTGSVSRVYVNLAI
jgi:hypothetical protein